MTSASSQLGASWKRTWKRWPGGQRKVASALGLIAVALGGALIGLAVAGPTSVDVGPFRSTFAITPTVVGDTEVLLPPLGSLQLDTHDGPAHLSIRLDGLDRTRTEALITDPAGITLASRDVISDLRDGMSRLIMRSLAAGVLGAMIAATLVYRRMRRVAWAGGLALAVLLGSFGVAALSFHPRALKEPRYDGLLANAPAIVGDAQRLADRYDEYATQLEKMVVNVGNLYNTVSSLPVYTPDDGTIRVLHVSDLHLNPAAWTVIRSAVEQFHIDIVVDTGDISDWGSEVEANFVGAIALLKVPYVFVRGNHDSALTQAAVAAQPNAIVLDNQVATIEGLTFAGIGDPRFTPDKAAHPQGQGESEETARSVQQAGTALGQVIQDSQTAVDIALVHDPRSAAPLAGRVPLALAGHTHQRTIGLLGRTTTRLMVQGSTGGAGLRGLEKGEPVSLQMSILYFDPARSLLAYDDITVGGAGLAEVTLKRHLIEPPTPTTPAPSTTPSS